jgi:tRNA modification GTPase
LTAPGEGGISIIALRGPGAAEFTAQRLRRRRGAAASVEPGNLAYGHFCDAHGEPLDEVVVACVSPDLVEINCHGGALPTRRILESLAGEGVLLESNHVAPVADVPRGALQTEALEALFAAGTTLAARVLAAQAGGLLETALRETLVALEAGKFSRACETLTSLVQTAPLGLALAKPRTVVLLGPVNAGKSTLVNALVGYERNIVTEVPGTTRDAVTVPAAVNGVPLVFVDTAGAAEARTSLDAAAQERAVQAGERADLALIVIDTAAPLRRGFKPPAGRKPTIIAANKCDLPPLAETVGALAGWPPPVVKTSGKTGEGLEELADAILSALGIPFPEDDAAERPVVFTLRQKRCIGSALRLLENGDKTGAAGHLRECIGRRTGG